VDIHDKEGSGADAEEPLSRKALSDLSSLYPWQREALAAWRANNRRGIVEAVTGAGKTRLGLAAAAESLNLGERVAIIVPRIELERQWLDNLRAALPRASLGRMGGGGRDSLATCQVLVAVGASAGRYDLGLGQATGLLIADECHRYGAEQNQLALEETFRARLGLSATYRRSDGAHETVLEPYFDRVVYELGYKRAIDDGVVTRFRVALLPVRLALDERHEYDELSDQLSRAKRVLVTRFGVPSEPYEQFLAAVNRLKTSGSRQEGIAAGRYWSALTKRRKLLSETPAKLSVLDKVARALGDADGSIVFTQTINGAEVAASALQSLGVDAEVMHSRLDPDLRRAVLRRFEIGKLKALVAPTLLDEGVDVPDADLALILAASQQRRQMIQRMGRILRVKRDGRQARFVIAYVEGSCEDPAGGAHEAFLSEVLDVADDVHQFSPGAKRDEVRAYLDPTTTASRSSRSGGARGPLRVDQGGHLLAAGALRGRANLQGRWHNRGRRAPGRMMTCPECGAPNQIGKCSYCKHAVPAAVPARTTYSVHSVGTGDGIRGAAARTAYLRLALSVKKNTKWQVTQQNERGEPKGGAC
jgi:RNA polymerase primary sigma factor